MLLTPTIVLDEPVACLTAHKNAAILRWRASPTPEVIRKINGKFLQDIQAERRSLHLFVVADTPAGVIDSATREAMTETLQQTEMFYASVTIAMLSEGFVAASLRAVLTGLKMLLHPPYPVKIFAALPEAIQNFRTETQGQDISALLRLAQIKPA